MFARNIGKTSPIHHFFKFQIDINADCKRIHLDFHQDCNFYIQNNPLIWFPLNDFKFFSPSFQSAFHLSFTLLVRYRFPCNIQLQMESTTYIRVAISNNTTHQKADNYCKTQLDKYGIFTLLDRSFSKITQSNCKSL